MTGFRNLEARSLWVRPEKEGDSGFDVCPVSSHCPGGRCYSCSHFSEWKQAEGVPQVITKWCSQDVDLD